MVINTAHDIRAIDIIHKPIVVIVNAVIRDLSRIDPHIPRQIFMGVINTCVDNSNHNVTVTPCRVPVIF